MAFVNDGNPKRFDESSSRQVRNPRGLGITWRGNSHTRNNYRSSQQGENSWRDSHARENTQSDQRGNSWRGVQTGDTESGQRSYSWRGVHTGDTEGGQNGYSWNRNVRGNNRGGYRGNHQHYSGNTGFRGRGKGSWNLQNRYCPTDPPEDAILAELFREMAEIYTKNSTPPVREDQTPDLIMPPVDDNTEICFRNHYGDTFFHLLRNNLKVMTFETTGYDSLGTCSRIKAKLRDIINDLHRMTDDKYCCIELDFLKIIFTDPKPNNAPPSRPITAEDMKIFVDTKSPQLPHFLHRHCLEEGGDESLLGTLRNLGVTVVEQIAKRPKTRVEVYSRGFDYKDHQLSGTVILNNDDLSFSSWNVFRWTSGACLLPNPGNKRDSTLQIDGPDLRLKGLASLKVNCEEMEEMCKKSNMTLPLKLTAPNLGGVLEKDGDSFIIDPASGIVGIFQATNRIKYVLKLINGVEFYLYITDMKHYRYDKRTESLVLDVRGDRWAKFKIPVPGRDEHAVTNCVDSIGDFMTDLMKELGSGNVKTKIFKTNYIHRGVPTPSHMVQNLRRRIIENDDLVSMLDLRGNVSREVILDRLIKLLEAVDVGRVPLPESAINKLKCTAHSEEFYVP